MTARTRSPGRRIAKPAAGSRRRTPAVGRLGLALLVACWLGSLVLAVAPLAADHGTQLWDVWMARTGAVVATWLAVLLLARRVGGPVPLVSVFAGLCAVGVLVAPRGWVLSSAAVVAATSYGVLGMLTTRPAAGLRSVREVVVAALVGAAGAVVVTGYDVGLRPYRFRMMVLALTLLTALALAWRLGLGLHSLGRRGLLLIVGAVVVLVSAVGYVQALRDWGSSGVVGSVSDLHDRIEGWLGASPRTIEALVGFPATIWGVAVRNRRRQGWWMSAFGSLAPAGVATSLIGPAALGDAAASTCYNVLIGTLLGLALIGVDRLLTGTGRRSRLPSGPQGNRPEPGRTGPLL